MLLNKYKVLFLFALILAGCNSLPSLDDVLPDTKNEYRKSRDLPVLEVPPDLTNTTNEAMSIPGENEAITLNEYQRQRTQATGSTVAGASSSRETSTSSTRDVSSSSSTTTSAPAKSVMPETPSSLGEAQLIILDGDSSYLALSDTYEVAWVNVQYALERAGVTIHNKTMSDGIYSVLFFPEGKKEEKGLLNELKFWGDDDEGVNFQISLVGVGRKTELIIIDDAGVWVSTPEAKELMDLILRNYNQK